MDQIAYQYLQSGKLDPSKQWTSLGYEAERKKKADAESELYPKS